MSALPSARHGRRDAVTARLRNEDADGLAYTGPVAVHIVVVGAGVVAGVLLGLSASVALLHTFIKRAGVL